MMALSEAREFVARFARQRILVVGDVMLDRYLYGAVERISPEAPVPVVHVRSQRSMPGGAANVAANIRALGGRVVLAGVTGRDAAGRELRRALRERGIDPSGLSALARVRTTVKERVLADRQQVVRVDWEDALELRPAEVRAFARRVAALVRECTGVILEDYAKGVVLQETVDAVLREARRCGVPVGLDPKPDTALRLAGLTLATPNYREALACAGLPPRTLAACEPLRDATLRRAAQILLRRWNPEQLIVTLGPQGMYLAAKGAPPQVIPTRAREVFDVSGAGDTVIATCLLAVTSGASCAAAAALGNHAAGVVVGKVGTACCSPAELLQSVERDEV
jgi:D-beta-D-heptose 7-phosphate kinase/D-beta-D-heptose 1-phosphate adenosyltransferase